MTGLCDGMRGLLQSRKADFSLMSLHVTDMAPNVSMTHPYGPTSSFGESFFGAFPIREGQNQSHTDVFDMILSSEWYVGPINVLLSLLLVLLINMNFNQHNRLRYLHRYQLIDLVSHLLTHPYRTYLRCYRRFCLLLLLWMQMWIMMTYMGAVNSDWTTKLPPTYMEKLSHVAESNRTVWVYHGMFLDHHFKVSKDPIDRKLSKKLVRNPLWVAPFPWKRMKRHTNMTGAEVAFIGTSPIASWALKTDGIVLAESSQSASSVAAVVCISRDYDPEEQFRFSESFMQTQYAIGISYNISSEVKKRVFRTTHSIFHSGINSRPANIMQVQKSNHLRKGLLLPCFEKIFSRQTKPVVSSIESLPIQVYESTGIIASAIIAVAFATFIIERYLMKQPVNKRRRRFIN